MKNYSIESWKHSADKDHTTMTGGTLTIDKTVRCGSGVAFYTYNIPMYRWSFDIDFHKWVHAAEHMIAYKKDTGSVRNSLEEVTGWEVNWKVILDISPYKTSNETFWFRITSMIPLKVDQVQKLMWISIKRAIIFLESWKIENEDDYQWIPFARPISCGQYDFHDKFRAIHDLSQIDIENLEIIENTIYSNHTTAYVCDLRFLKPKIQWWDDMIMFSPDFSYRISLLIERKLPNKIPWSIALVWTFGCMTGMYLCISSNIWDETDISVIHATILEIIRENIDTNTLNWAERIQLETLLKNYDTHNLK